MVNILVRGHFDWRYIVLLVLTVAIIKFLIGILGKQSWSKFDQILGVATPIVIDIQWLLGIVLWLMGPSGWFLNRGSVNFAEHAGTMTLALAAAHMGWVRAKRASSDGAKFQAAFLGYLIAGILVALGVARITGWM